LACAAIFGADESVEKTIKDLYASSQAAVCTARTKEELARAAFPTECLGYFRN
jgi:hypothetical protein